MVGAALPAPTTTMAAAAPEPPAPRHRTSRTKQLPPVHSPQPSRLSLIDGPIMETQARRQKVVLSMAEVLIEHEAWHDVHDARLTLLMCGYSVTELHCLL